MKVVLFTLNGSWSHSSLALRCLRQPLEAAGHEVTLIEFTLRDRTSHILEQLYAAHADLYGFSCYIWNITEMLSIGETLARLLPQSHIVLGGPEVSYATERFERMDWIATVVCGEGEDVMPMLCQRLADGQPMPKTVKGTPAKDFFDAGILYRNQEKCGSIVYYESSRGCPYSCAYCLSSATHGLRAKSVEQTLSDLQAFEALDGEVRIIKFVDRTFNADPKRANAIWQALLEDRFTKHYHFEVTASLLNEESFEIFAKFPKGKLQMEFGLQSTNPQTLAAVSRHINPQKVISAVRRIHNMGNIHVHLDLIAGLPYEDYASFARSFDDAYGCCDLLQLGFLKLLYGTPLRERAEEYGYRTLAKPPYTVLESKWLTYPDMQRLSHIAETLERYMESGRFAHTLWYLDARMPSPFAFWQGLSERLCAEGKPLQKLSQNDAYRILLEYAAGLAGVESEQLKQMLTTDYAEHEHKNPPWFLR